MRDLSERPQQPPLVALTMAGRRMHRASAATLSRFSAMFDTKHSSSRSRIRIAVIVLIFLAVTVTILSQFSLLTHQMNTAAVAQETETATATQTSVTDGDERIVAVTPSDANAVDSHATSAAAATAAAVDAPRKDVVPTDDALMPSTEVDSTVLTASQVALRDMREYDMSPLPAESPCVLHADTATYMVQSTVDQALMRSARHKQTIRANGPVRLIDGFTFNNEFEALLQRLLELMAVVDFFILVESPYSFQNTTKPLHFREYLERHRLRPGAKNNVFAPFLHKIIHVVVDDYAHDFAYWENEVLYRDAIGVLGFAQLDRHLQKIGQPMLRTDDIVIVGDIDEVPQSQILDFLKRTANTDYYLTPRPQAFFHPVMLIDTTHTYYSYYWPTGLQWQRVRVVLMQAIMGNQNKTNGVRFNSLGYAGDAIWTIYSNNGFSAGYHCSWCLSIDDIHVKLSTFSHSEMNKESMRDRNRIEAVMNSGKWLGDNSPLSPKRKSPLRAGVEAPVQACRHWKLLPHLFASMADAGKEHAHDWQ